MTFASLRMHAASSPYLLERRDALQVAQYRVLRQILAVISPQVELPPDYADLDLSIFDEMTELYALGRKQGIT